MYTTYTTITHTLYTSRRSRRTWRRAGGNTLNHLHTHTHTPYPPGSTLLIYRHTGGYLDDGYRPWRRSRRRRERERGCHRLPGDVETGGRGDTERVGNQGNGDLQEEEEVMGGGRL